MSDNVWLLLTPRRICNRRWSFLCLSVCLLATLRQTSERICMKFSGKVGNGPTNKRLNFGGDPDQESESNPNPYSDTGKAFLGGGMHCPSTSSINMFCCAYTYYVYAAGHKSDKTKHLEPFSVVRITITGRECSKSTEFRPTFDPPTFYHAMSKFLPSCGAH